MPIHIGSTHSYYYEGTCTYRGIHATLNASGVCTATQEVQQHVHISIEVLYDYFVQSAISLYFKMLQLIGSVFYLLFPVESFKMFSVSSKLKRCLERIFLVVMYQARHICD